METSVESMQEESIKHTRLQNEQKAPTDATVESVQQELQVTSTRHPREGWPKWRWPLIHVYVALGAMVYGYDASNIANIQPSIVIAFGRIELLAWTVASVTLTNMATLPLLRRLLMIFNVRWIVLMAFVLICVGTVISGSASSMSAMIVGRVITGCGTGSLYQSTVMYTVAFNLPHELLRSQSIIGAFWTTGLILGPIVGGAFASNAHATWRWAMYINLPIVGIGFTFAAAFLPPLYANPDKETPMWHKLAAIDWIGAILHMAFCFLLCTAIILSGSTWAWNSGSSIAIWIIVLVITLTYLGQQLSCFFTTRQRRIFPLELLGLRAVLLCGLSTSCVGSAYGLVLNYTPLFFAFAHGLSPISAAVRLLPFLGTFIGATAISGALLPVTGRYALFYIASSAFIAIGGGLCTTITINTPQQRILGYEALIGCGCGMTFQTGLSILAQLLPPNRKLDVPLIHITMQTAGVALSVAISGCIFQNLGFRLLESSIGGVGFSDSDIRAVLAGADSPVLDGSDPQTRTLALRAITDVIARLFWMVTAAGSLGFVCGCLMDFRRLSFKNEEHGDVEKD